MQNNQFNKGRWLPEEDEALKMLHSKGCTSRQIFENYNNLIGNRSLHGVRNRIHLLRVEGKIVDECRKSQSWSKEEVELLKQLIEEGKTTKEIYQKYGSLLGSRSYDAVSTKVSLTRRDMGLLQHKESAEDKNQMKAWTNEQTELLLKYLDEGLSDSEIFKQHSKDLGDRSYGSIRRKSYKIRHSFKDAQQQTENVVESNESDLSNEHMELDITNILDLVKTMFSMIESIQKDVCEIRANQQVKKGWFK